MLEAWSKDGTITLHTAFSREGKEKVCSIPDRMTVLLFVDADALKPQIFDSSQPSPLLFLPPLVPCPFPRLLSLPLPPPFLFSHIAPLSSDPYASLFPQYIITLLFHVLLWVYSDFASKRCHTDLCFPCTP